MVLQLRDWPQLVWFNLDSYWIFALMRCKEYFVTMMTVLSMHGTWKMRWWWRGFDSCWTSNREQNFEKKKFLENWGDHSAMTRTDAYVTIFLVLAQRTVQHVCCDYQSILLLMALISTQSGIKQLFPLRFLKNKRIFVCQRG